MTRLTKMAATTALVLTAGLGLTACGDDSDSTDDSDTKTSSGETEGGEAPDDLMERITEAQLDAGSVAMTVTTTAGGTDVVAEGQSVISEDPEDTAVAVTTAIPGAGDLEMRLVDGELYLNLGPTTADKFVVVDTEEGPLADQFGPLLDQMDPARQFKTFEEALVEIEQDGEPETIDGVEATPYRLVLDSEKVMESAGISPEDLGGTEIPETLESTIYVGDDDLPRRIVTDVLGAQSTIDFTAWGEDVEITAPGPDEISDVDPFSGAPAA